MITPFGMRNIKEERGIVPRRHCEVHMGVW